jgi:hypothetical protein
VPLHQLAVAPADVTGSLLGLVLNAPAQTPLATCRIEHPGVGALVLGVLGASHVVAVEHPTRGFSEEVSCAAQTHGGGALPAHAHAPGYQLESELISRGEIEFRSLAQKLRQRCADDPCWLGGTFPGDEAALTVLAAAVDGPGWRWRTWHLYPECHGGSVVYTSSRWRP